MLYYEEVVSKKYEVVRYEGFEFFFKYETDPPGMLHIYARGMFKPEDAIEVWFEGTEELENVENNRFETYTDKRGIYWYWLDTQQTKIMIISCFQRTS
ncbi:MAG: hypothetical protein IPJ49_29100 [Candidatus Obscuribacter sp.]|nr:hypothetical protein [Candidatus Obscuribacter sp.]